MPLHRLTRGTYRMGCHIGVTQDPDGTVLLPVFPLPELRRCAAGVRSYRGTAWEWLRRLCAHRWSRHRSASTRARLPQRPACAQRCGPCRREFRGHPWVGGRSVLAEPHSSTRGRRQDVASAHRPGERSSRRLVRSMRNDSGTRRRVGRADRTIAGTRPRGPCGKNHRSRLRSFAEKVAQSTSSMCEPSLASPVWADPVSSLRRGRTTAKTCPERWRTRPKRPTT